VVSESSDEEEKFDKNISGHNLVQQQQNRWAQQAQQHYPTAQFGLPHHIQQQQQQQQQQQLYAEMLQSRTGLQSQYRQFPPQQRKRRRRTPSAICIKDGRVFLRPFTDLPAAIQTKSLPPEPEITETPNPYQPPNLGHPSLYNPYNTMFQQLSQHQTQLTISQLSLRQQQPIPPLRPAPSHTVPSSLPTAPKPPRSLPSDDSQASEESDDDNDLLPILAARIAANKAKEQSKNIVEEVLEDDDIVIEPVEIKENRKDVIKMGVVDETLIDEEEVIAEEEDLVADDDMTAEEEDEVVDEEEEDGDDDEETAIDEEEVAAVGGKEKAPEDLVAVENKVEMAGVADLAAVVVGKVMSEEKEDHGDILTFSEDTTKDVQEAEEEIPTPASEIQEDPKVSVEANETPEESVSTTVEDL